MKFVPAKTTSSAEPAALAPRTWYADVPHSTKIPKAAGYAAIALVIAGFGLWANIALITGAIVANGLFVATGQNKIVQHLEGGVIKDILVREGDIVDADQTLVRLDDTSARADLRRLVIRHALSRAKTARYMAEIQDAKDVDFPADLTGNVGDIDFREIIETQKLTFEARRKSVATQVAALADSIDALQKRIDAGGIQEDSVKQQVDLIREELQ